jgi:hypothetical protein
VDFHQAVVVAGGLELQVVVMVEQAEMEKPL